MKAFSWSTPARSRALRPATALLFLAFAALLVSALHGTVPHHSLPGPCHECEALASPADLAPRIIVVAPSLPDRPEAPRADVRPDEPPARRPGSPRAPPSPSAA